MKVIVIGAGGVGLHLAKTLSWEGHEVTLIDNKQELIDRAGGTMDLLAIRGSGTSISTLVKAEAPDADLLVAVTSVDEVNIVSCMLARQLGVKRRIARVRNQEYSKPDIPIKLADLGIDQIIHPELEVAREVAKLVRYQQAIEVVECAGGKMLLLGVKVDDGAPILGVPLGKITSREAEIPYRLVAISRGGQTIIPSGKDVIKAQDKVFVIAGHNDVESVFQMAGKLAVSSRHVMLMGGGMLGRISAEELEKDGAYNVKLVESDPELIQRAVQRLQRTLVVQAGSEADFDVLAVEGLAETGVFAALTDDDENNIVTTLFARHLGVKRTITLVSKPEYMPIVRAIGLDAAINVKILTSDAVMKHLIGQRIISVSSLTGVDAEIIEFAISAKSRIVGRKIRDIGFPKGTIVGAIDHQGEVAVAVGDSVVHQGDRMVVFCDQSEVPKVEKLLE